MLDPDPLPPEFAAALSGFQLIPGPELRLSAMPTARLEYGLLDSDELHVSVRITGVAVRSLALWLFIVGFYGVAWAVSH